MCVKTLADHSNMVRVNHVFVFLSLLSTSWSGQMTDEVSSMTPAIEVKDGLSQAVNEFGFRLMKEMMKKKEYDNVVISPIGVAGLLAMTLLGSVGATYDELADSLGFSQDILANRRNHEQFGALLGALNADQVSQTLYADAIFVDGRTKIRAAYRDYLNRVYRGDALGTDFRDNVKAKEMINNWVTNHTNGKIEDFIKDPLPAITQVVLVNALYFKGQWAQPFMPNYTRQMTFKRPSGEVQVDLMLNAGSFNTIRSKTDGVYMISFPYNDSTTTMYVMKPFFPKRQTITELINSLDYAKIDNLINRMTEDDFVIRFPKMDLEARADLEGSMKALGIKSIFDPLIANFALMVDGNTMVNQTEDEIITRINRGDVEGRGLKDILNGLPNPGVHVDTVLHDVKMTINEYGTEAAAASSGQLARSALLFYADTPFFMFIRNEKTKLVTFSAVIYDPTV